MMFGCRKNGAYCSTILFVLLCLVLSAMSCGQKSTIDSDTYFQPYFEAYQKADGPEKIKVIYALDSVFYQFRSPTITDKLKFYNIKSSFSYERIRDTTRALVYLDSLIHLCKGALDSPGVVPAYIHALEFKGLIYFSKGAHDEGFYYVGESRNAEKTLLADSCSLERSNAVPGFFFRYNKFDLAIQYYLQNMAISFACQPLTFERFYLIQNSLNSIGLAYHALAKYDSADYYLDSAVSFIANSRALFPGNNFLNEAAGVVLNTKGYVADSRGEVEKAANFYRQSIAMVEHISPRFSLSSKIAISRLYINTKYYDKAKASLDSTFLNFNLPKPDITLREYHYLNFVYFESKHIFDSALIHYKQYEGYKTKLINADVEVKQFDIKREMAAKQTQFENASLSSDISIKRFQLTIAVLACMIAVLAGVFAWSNYRKSNRHVTELELLNTKVNISHDQLLQSFSLLEQSHLANTHLMRTVAHDLKNPVSGIRLLVKAEKKRAGDDVSKGAMDLISGACDNLLEVINDLLAQKSRFSTAEKELVDLAWLLESCVGLLRMKAEEKDQTILLSAVPVLAHVHKEKVWRVISNLIHNAIKFSDPGSDIEVSLSEENNMAVIKVRDYGIGIPKELGEKIFAMDDMSKSRPGTEGEQSHGLGLSISRNIIEEHRGKIWYEDNEAPGTIFYVILPLS